MAKGKYHEWLAPDGLITLEMYAREGMTDEQIAAKMGISPKTLYRWMNDHCPIRQAIKKGKAPVDFAVENALLKRALGFGYKEITREPVKNEDGETVMAITKTVTKMVVPDTAAAFIWLKNRRPDRWRDKPEERGGKEQVVVIDDL